MYKRTGDASICSEADYQELLASLGYPVPRITDSGKNGETCYFVERSAGESLHDQAIATAGEHGHVPDKVISAAADISLRLLDAQAHNPLPGSPAALQAWFDHAAFAADVFDENPDLDTPRTHNLAERALDRLRDVPMCRSHMDYGLPNAFPAGVIDWQRHDKHIKWLYRRALFDMGLEQYESSRSIRTGRSPLWSNSATRYRRGSH
jgi:Phosphotransferase enzyme family